MNVKHVHEDAEPQPKLRTQAELRRRNGFGDGKQLSIRRADDQSLALRREAIGIAKKGYAPKRERRESGGGPGREFEQQQIGCEKQSNEAPTVAVNGNPQTLQARFGVGGFYALSLRPRVHARKGAMGSSLCRPARLPGSRVLQPRRSGDRGRYHMPITQIDILTIQPLVALLFGILVLAMPRLLNYLIGIYLVLIGAMGLWPHLFTATV